MMRARDYRTMARAALQGNYGMAATAGLVQYAIEMGLIIVLYLIGILGVLVAAVSGSAAALAVIAILVAVPIFLIVLAAYMLIIGMNKICLNLALGEKARLGDMFSILRGALLWKTMGLTFLFLIVTCLLIAPYGALMIVYNLSRADVLVLPMAAAYVFYLAAMLFIWLSFGLACPVLLDNPSAGVFGSLGASWRLLSGSRWRFFCLSISFTGWYLLGVCSFGVGYLWIGPYFMTTLSEFYLDRKKERENFAGVNL